MSQFEYDRAIGAQLKSLREAAGISQERFCNEIGFDQSRLSKVERNGPTACSWLVLCQIADALGYEAEVQLHRKMSKGTPAKF